MRMNPTRTLPAREQAALKSLGGGRSEGEVALPVFAGDRLGQVVQRF